MAVEAELHLQRRVLIDQRHLIDGAVAGVAADSLINVNAVIEIDEVRELVNARPFERTAAAETLAHRLEIGRIGPDLRVAVHARLRRRNAGKARRLDRGMTVTAVDPKTGDVVLVAERNRLRLADSGVGNVRSALQQHQTRE